MWGRGTVLGGRYTLAERIGGGAMGEVWRAVDDVLEREVAVKILLPALLEDAMFAGRFRREAKVLAALHHPGIVNVHDYGEEETDSDSRVAYIVMELLDGRPLDAVQAGGGEISPGRALGIVAEALDALHAAHQRDIVHRDIKPSNLMLRSDGRVTVTDFGIARTLTSSKITASHSVIGTALYIAPERAEGAAATPESDLYSVGVLCYELLAGELPFTGETVIEIVLKHVTEPAPDLPAGFPEPVCAFVAKALAKKPEDRYGDAAAMAAAARLAAAALGPDGALLPGAAGPAPATPRAARDGSTAGAAQRPWWKWRGSPVALLIPAVVVAVVVTVLRIDASPDQSRANAPDARPAMSASSGRSSSASPSVAASPAASASASDAGSAALPSGSAAGGGTGATQPANPGQAGGIAPGGSAVGGAGGRGASGGSGGSNPGSGSGSGGTGSGGSNPGSGGGVSTPTPTKPAPTPPAPPPGPTRAAGCNTAGDITNVGDGLKVGLSAGSPTGGTAVIMGGTTAYGWVHSTPNAWDHFNACNLSDPELAMPYMSSGAELSTPLGGYSTNWRLANGATSGSRQLRDYQGQSCLTDNGEGKQLTMATCTPGNTSQEWWIP